MLHCRALTCIFLCCFTRSIILNPVYFRNHLRQATVFRCLERYSEAARYVWNKLGRLISSLHLWLPENSKYQIHTCMLMQIHVFWLGSLASQNPVSVLMHNPQPAHTRWRHETNQPLCISWEVELLTCAGNI